ncbi:MAG: hypothetical protein MK078_11100 [Crocinitomicaceae bacterium]|nr:hypothetical protein [Crocinitomicaceae bacterium]
MKYLAILLLAGLGFQSCNRDGIAPGTPKCIEDKILEFETNKLCAEGAKVDLYTFQGEFVYAFEQGNCGADLTTEIVSEDCQTLGFLGGISGNTEINGESFENAIFQNNVWLD